MKGNVRHNKFRIRNEMLQVKSCRFKLHASIHLGNCGNFLHIRLLMFLFSCLILAYTCDSDLFRFSRLKIRN